MVRVLFATLAVIFASQVSAFAPVGTSGRVGTELSASKIGEVRKTLASLDKDNFSASLATVEPFLLNDAGASIYKKSMRKISTAAGLLGVEVPADYAKAAKATQKRREKQDAFIQQKEAERLEAEAASAEEEPAEEEVAEAEPVEA